jgi:hypothetical protein
METNVRGDIGLDVGVGWKDDMKISLGVDTREYPKVSGLAAWSES